MVRTIFIFSIACILGLLVQATLVHAIFPSAIAPDFILVLVVFLGLKHNSVLGVVGAFMLGVAADFASGQFIGPNAAGCVVAFSLVLIVSKKVYAEHLVAVMFLTALCSFAKGLTQALMFLIYLKVDFFTGEIFRLIMIESTLSGIVSPIVIKLLLWSSYQTPTATRRFKAVS